MGIQAIKEEVFKLNKTEQAELMHYMVELLLQVALICPENGRPNWIGGKKPWIRGVRLAVQLKM